MAQRAWTALILLAVPLCIIALVILQRGGDSETFTDDSATSDMSLAVYGGIQKFPASLGETPKVVYGGSGPKIDITAAGGSPKVIYGEDDRIGKQ